MKSLLPKRLGRFVLAAIVITFERLFAEDAKVSLDDSAYIEKNAELATIVKMANDVVASKCKSENGETPASIQRWTKAAKAYQDSEALRDSNYNNSIAQMQNQVESISKDKGTSDLQMESVKIQINSVDAAIFTIGGEKGRIANREKLAALIAKALDQNKLEKDEAINAYKDLFSTGFPFGIQAAQRGCDRKKDDKTPDPVKGCEEAISGIPLISDGPAKEHQMLFTTKVASKDLNVKMKKLARYAI